MKNNKGIIHLYKQAAGRLQNDALLLSIVISVILHALFFIYSTGIKLPGFETLRKPRPSFSIKTEPAASASQSSIKRVSYLKALKFENPTLPSTRPAGLSSVTDEKLEEKNELITEPTRIGTPLAIGGQEGPEEDEKVLEQKTERKTRKDIVETGKGINEGAVALPQGTPAEMSYSEDFFDKMPGITPNVTGGIVQKLKEGVFSKFASTETTPIRKAGDYSGLDEYFVYSLSTFEDPQDKQKYYRLTILAGKDVEKLKRMPKEIIFVIDCSLSIQKERLDEFKEGIIYCLKNLNQDDVFNIMAFKENVMWFKPNSVKPDPQIVKEAGNFVDGLTAGETTDAYKALLEAIKIKETITPSYIIMFSDGRPTCGVTDSRRIINEISRTNKGSRPIFVLTGGLRVNRYFLDFISYKNRAWSEYAPRAYTVSKHIQGMYKKIKDPILLDVRYLSNGLNEKEIFPKMLPDFFRYADFSLYGTYNNENDFSLQLLGDIGNEVNEFIIVDALKNAKKGDKDIAKEWAFNKIYYLIGLLENEGENAKIIEEINSLCNKFGIITPYSEQIKK